MALGALIAAYQEDDSGGLRALLPLAGRTLVEYQARCAAAAGAAPIVIAVERIPTALRDAFERLRIDGIGVVPVSDASEAATRFDAGALILLIGDGIAPTAELVAQLADEPELAVAAFPDDEKHQQFERVDAKARWAGLAIVDAQTLASTAAILGDWDLQSTLLRRTLQAGAARVTVAPGAAEPLLADGPEKLQHFEQELIAGSRGTRNDWASRYILSLVEEITTKRLMETGIRPGWLVWGALGLTLLGAFAFTRGWLGTGLALLALSTPLDLVARRLAYLRLRPLSKPLSRLLWPSAGLALLALGYWEARQGSGWGAIMTAIAAAAFAEAARIEKGSGEMPGQIWLFSRRNAVLLAVPFALAGAWIGYLVGLFVYAAGSFFFIQHAAKLSQVDPPLTELP